MASAKATATFFTNGTYTEYEHVLKLYPQALKLKAERKSKKPEELVKLDNWYQNELPKKIKSRGKDAHMIHEELVQCMKWKQTRGKYYPQLSYLVKVNTPRAVMAETKRAFKKLPNLEQAITALSNLKGVGTTMASALLAAACPETAPFMADECLLAIPDIEGIDYTTKEYLKFVQHIQAVTERLNKESKDTNREDAVVWSPHKVELALWTHYIMSDLKPEALSTDAPVENGNSIISSTLHQNGDSLDAATTSEESNQEIANGKNTANNTTSSSSSSCASSKQDLLLSNTTTSSSTKTKATAAAVLDEDTNASFADQNTTSSHSNGSSPASIGGATTLTTSNNTDNGAVPLGETEETNDSIAMSDSTTNDSTTTAPCQQREGARDSAAPNANKRPLEEARQPEEEEGEDSSTNSTENSLLDEDEDSSNKEPPNKKARIEPQQQQVQEVGDVK